MGAKKKEREAEKWKINQFLQIVEISLGYEPEFGK